MPKMGKKQFDVVYVSNGAGHYLKCPVLTTTQRDALTGIEGMIIFNSTTDQLEEYDGSTWEAVGQVILDTHTADYGLHTKVIRKAANQSLTTDNTLQADDELILPVGASEVWLLRFFIIVNSPGAADIQFSLTVPSGTTLDCNFSGNTTATWEDGDNSGKVSTADSTDVIIHFYAIVVVSTTAGNVVLNWAQYIESGTTTVKANSCIIGTKLA